MKRSLVWFKTDLRIQDNEALFRACERSDEVIPFYCFDDRLFSANNFGFSKIGNHRLQFLLESLNDLASSLQELGSNLILLRGKPEEEIPKLAVHWNAHQVYAKKEVAFEEKETESRVESALWKASCELCLFSTSTLYHAVDLPFAISAIPDVFTTFRKGLEKDSKVRDAFPGPEKLISPILPEFVLPTLSDFGMLQPLQDVRAAMNFVGGEKEALKRLHYYFFESSYISKYKETRDGLIGSDYSTKFSPWMAIGCISPRTIYHELKKFENLNGANESTYWLIFELLWRDFFRFMMKKHRQKYFLQSGIKSKSNEDISMNPELFRNWVEGKTGCGFVDANMNELAATGFMSNRGRQNVASYLCHDLKLDWRYGAAYFEQQLIDYDVCSNWGNWSYIAGVGNDPRADRKFNMEKQSAQYDPDKKYEKLWLNQS